jgi:hypothetical protein
VDLCWEVKFAFEAAVESAVDVSDANSCNNIAFDSVFFVKVLDMFDVPIRFGK